MTESAAYCLFDTAIGVCAVIWNDRGIAGAQLPEGGVRRARLRIAARFPDARDLTPQRQILRVIERITALLGGCRDNLTDVVLDDEGLTDFQRQVYAITRAIPPGRTRTYGQIAQALGDPLAARAVGQVLGQNPYPIIVPCHRVLAAGGKAGGFSANGGLTTKARLLSIEGASIGDEPSLFDRLPLAIAPRRTRVAPDRPIERDTPR